MIADEKTNSMLELFLDHCLYSDNRSITACTNTVSQLGRTAIDYERSSRGGHARDCEQTEPKWALNFCLYWSDVETNMERLQSSS